MGNDKLWRLSFPFWILWALLGEVCVTGRWSCMVSQVQFFSFQLGVYCCVQYQFSVVHISINIAKSIYLQWNDTGFWVFLVSVEWHFKNSHRQETIISSQRVTEIWVAYKFNKFCKNSHKIESQSHGPSTYDCNDLQMKFWVPLWW